MWCYLPRHDTVTQVCSQVHDCLITPIRHANELAGIAGISLSHPAGECHVLWHTTQWQAWAEASSKMHLVLQSNNSSRLQVHEPIFLMNYWLGSRDTTMYDARRQVCQVKLAVAMVDRVLAVRKKFKKGIILYKMCFKNEVYNESGVICTCACLQRKQTVYLLHHCLLHLLLSSITESQVRIHCPSYIIQANHFTETQDFPMAILARSISTGKNVAWFSV